MAGRQIPVRRTRSEPVDENEMLIVEQAHLDSDPIVSAHRVALQSKDGHALWVTSRVLDESAPLPDHVEGGLILRDVIGAPTGVFQHVLDPSSPLPSLT